SQFHHQNPIDMKRTLLLLFLSVVLCGHAMAQTRPVAGKVTDKADGSPLPGVTISIKGTSKGTITNTQGEYRIEAGSGDVLVFSFIGYATQELPVPGGGVLNVSMGPDDKTLSEVVVTGYVDINRRDA